MLGHGAATGTHNHGDDDDSDQAGAIASADRPPCGPCCARVIHALLDLIPVRAERVLEAAQTLSLALGSLERLVLAMGSTADIQPGAGSMCIHSVNALFSGGSVAPGTTWDGPSGLGQRKDIRWNWGGVVEDILAGLGDAEGLIEAEQAPQRAQQPRGPNSNPAGGRDGLLGAGPRGMVDATFGLTFEAWLAHKRREARAAAETRAASLATSAPKRSIVALRRSVVAFDRWMGKKKKNIEARKKEEEERLCVYARGEEETLGLFMVLYFFQRGIFRNSHPSHTSSRPIFKITAPRLHVARRIGSRPARSRSRNSSGGPSARTASAASAAPRTPRSTRPTGRGCVSGICVFFWFRNF
jgi:hypothetical protein